EYTKISLPPHRRLHTYNVRVHPRRAHVRLAHHRHRLDAFAALPHSGVSRASSSSSIGAGSGPSYGRRHSFSMAAEARARSNSPSCLNASTTAVTGSVVMGPPQCLPKG